jgi:uncharacterized protein YecE (DUF72 family)
MHPRSPRIGCAGWTIPAGNRDAFSGEGSVLERYAAVFDLVEINSSFYRSHQPRTYARWAASVPPVFRFTAKLPKTITHEHGLHGVAGLLDRFIDEVSELGQRLGGLLVQLPPSLALQTKTVERFFALLRRRYAGRIACEPRHASWFQPGTAMMWRDYRVARVGVDPAPMRDAEVVGGSAVQWRYWRWHGSPRVYYSAYGEDRLRAMQAQVAQHGAARAWCIFDNTAHGHATTDALRFRGLWSKEQHHA